MTHMSVSCIRKLSGTPRVRFWKYHPHQIEEALPWLKHNALQEGDFNLRHCSGK